MKKLLETIFGGIAVGGMAIGGCLSIIAIVIFLFAIVPLILGFVVKFLWIAVLVPLFGLPLITYWQSVGLVFLVSIVGSFFRGGKTVIKSE